MLKSMTGALGAFLGLYASAWAATGDQIVIPPVSGIVVTTKGSDTLATLAVKYQSDAQTILDFNRLRSPQLTAGKDGAEVLIWEMNAALAA